jgi:hypothetical protein
LTEKERTPSFYDFFAAAILANGIALLWDYVLSVIPSFILLSLPVYIMAGFVSSYLVCKRTTKKHLIVGFKTVVGASLMSILMIGSVATEINVGTVFILIACYFIGGTVAAYLTLRRQLKIVKTETESKTKTEDESSLNS